MSRVPERRSARPSDGCDARGDALALSVGDAIVARAGILFGHLHDQRLQLRLDSRFADQVLKRLRLLKQRRRILPWDWANLNHAMVIVEGFLVQQQKPLLGGRVSYKGPTRAQHLGLVGASKITERRLEHAALFAVRYGKFREYKVPLLVFFALPTGATGASNVWLGWRQRGGYRWLISKYPGIHAALSHNHHPSSNSRRHRQQRYFPLTGREIAP